MEMQIKNTPPKLSIPQQIADMESRGITFSLCNKIDARVFLAEHNYYFKLKAYAHNFERYRDPDKKRKYINLDFAHLKDLSTIDSHFRKIILTMCVDLEHFLKVKMLNDCTKVDEDGYEIVEDFLKMMPDLTEEIEAKTNTSTCHIIVQKYHERWALWNIVELLSFGPFIELYKLFYARNSNLCDGGSGLLYAVKMIRNAAAHNNCLLNQMRAPFSREIEPSYELKNAINQLSSLRPDAVKAHLKHPTVHDFLALILLYEKIVPDPTRSKGLVEVKKLFDERMVKNAEYYQKQQGLIATYKFVKEILDKITEASV